MNNRFSYISYGPFVNFNFKDGTISGIPEETTSDFFNTLITNTIKENKDTDVQDFVHDLGRLRKGEQDLANKIVEDYRDLNKRYNQNKS